MISKHSLSEITGAMILQAVEKTPRCAGFLIDRKGVKSRQKELINHICDERSLEKIII
jgi:D-aminoacyl-tRNA deacylase